MSESKPDHLLPCSFWLSFGLRIQDWYHRSHRLYCGCPREPRRFNLDGQTIEVGEVLDRWYQVESKPEWPRADYFKVRAVNGREYLLKHDLEADEWLLRQQWQAEDVS